MSTHRDPRYGTALWQRVRLRVLKRDNWTCRIVVGCTNGATVADHIIPTYPGMPNDLFFGMDNLRAGCREHNLARAQADKLVPQAPSTVVAKDFS